MNMESIDRIEKAKLQYENLLLNLGNGALDDDSINFDLKGPSSGTLNYEDIGVGKK